jgi:N4-gp56 family major capsid protein
MATSNLTVYGDISPRTAGKAKKKLLMRGQHMMVTERFGQFDPLGKNMTKTAKYRRYNSLARATAPLAEGVPPSGSKLTFTDVECTLEQYGDYTPITDVIADTHEDPVLNEAMKVLGEQMGETVEEVRINVLKAGSNVFYAGFPTTSSRASVNSPPTRGDFRRIYRYFKKFKAREITEIVRASAMISTEPVESAYWVMGHTDLDADFRGIPGFIPSAHYSDSTKRIPGEIGKIEQFRIVLTAMFDSWQAAGTSGTTYLSSGARVTSSTAADVYPIICVARDSYAIVPLQGFNSVNIAVVNPGNPSKGDELGQQGFASWKTYQASVILNSNWVARLEGCATASPS